MPREKEIIGAKKQSRLAKGLKYGARLVFWSLALVLFLGYASAIEAQDDKTFLWRVSDSSGPRLYLLGSVHLAQENMYPLKPVIEETFNKSDALLVEVDLEKVDLKTLNLDLFKVATYPGNETIWDHLDAQTAELLRDRLKDLKLSDVMFNKLRPWLVALTLGLLQLNVLGYQDQLGLDVHFIKQASAKGLGVFELESASEQFDALVSFSESEGMLFLKSTLLEFDEIGTETAAIFKCWKEGDAAGFEDLFFKTLRENPDLAPVFRLLIDERNKTMFTRLKPYMEKFKAPFVVIGASHLVGKTGLIAAFKAAGYEVNQL
ncbi:MAG: TraB/GumN family protein [Deltaproteobacteria bacterium]|jgi:uncharacterized protein YbaP (TraB family)|nr:TraB/GumN family protein [Deltaproteobacteria bacterium]